MVDILLFAMVIASAVSLVVVSPRHEQQKTLRALREYDDTKQCRTQTVPDSHPQP
jgi:hypothetical protein